MTGQPGYASGVVTNATHEQVMRQATAERRTLAALLTDAGYQTKAMGKMHFDPVRACYGFESMTLPFPPWTPRTALPPGSQTGPSIFWKRATRCGPSSCGQALPSRTRPQALENGYFRTRPAPEFPGDVDFRWLGFHYKDYRFDVFH